MIDTRFLRGVAAVLMMVAGAMPAAAQMGSSTSSPPPDDGGANRSRSPAAPTAPVAPATPAEILRGAACVTQAGPAITRAVLDTAPRTPEERRAAVAVQREAERCLHLGHPMIASFPMLRGTSAEALYEAQFATPVTPRTPALAAKPMTRPPTPQAPAGGPPPFDLGPTYSLSECVAPARPDLVRAFLATEPGTPEEQAGIQGLGPAFNTCLPAGTQLHVDTRYLRNVMAEALYRWSVVQRDGPTSPWAAEATAAPAAAPATPATPPPRH